MRDNTERKKIKGISMNYSKLNEGLDEYLQKYENTFYVSNLDMNINLIREGNKRFDLFKMIGSDEINLKPQEKNKWSRNTQLGY